MSEAIHLDRAVVRRILNGDDSAFHSLFDRFFPRLYRFALARLGGEHDAAEDVVQQTFCKALEQLDTYRGEAALYTWFCRICRNTLADYCRSSHRKLRTITPLEEQPAMRAILEAFTAPAIDQPEMAAWQRDIGRLVQATLDVLPDRYGEILEWKYVDGLPVKDIAARLELGAKAAESLLTRARSAFREAITALAETPDALRPPRQNWEQR